SDTLWKDAWEPGFSSLETERFFIAAPSVEGCEGKIRLRLIESHVFGSGQHATTQALIRLLEKRVGQGRFLDVGTGTGVLCLVAHHLGFTTLCGTDIEESAVLISKENAELNDVSIDLIFGSLPTAHDKWDVIACNILPPTLTDLLRDLKPRLAPEGSLYLAGFNEANADGVLAELTRLNLTVAEECKVRGWVGWLVTHSK
ncbi:MAG: methyltransferase domain-containing protein, partial [Proteobacteria bacterium]